MDTMSDLLSPLETPPASGAATDAARIAEINAFLSSQFEATGRPVPDFDFTPRTVAHLYSISSLSQSRSRAAAIVTGDLRTKAGEYRAQAARIREILDSVGLGQERLSPNAIGSAQIVAKVADLLSIRDTETSR